MVTVQLVSAGLRKQATNLRQDRLVRTSWPLLLNTGSNALLGIAYWVVAARLYDQATIGTNMAVIAAMTTLSGISQLNLGPSLGVLVPRAGAHGRRVVLQVYAVVTLYAMVTLTVFFVLVLPHLTQLDAVLGSGSRPLMFAAGVLAFNIFALQDAALVSLRRSAVVPVENAAFGVAKVLLAVLLAAGLPEFGIFTSWVLPLLIIVPVVSGFVFRGPPAERSTLPTITPRNSVPKLAGDYVGYLFQVCSTFFLPVIALELLKPVDASLFAVAWLTSSTLDLMATNIGTALIVETSYGEDPRALRRTIFRRAVPAVAIVTVVGMILAPAILRLYGSEYAGQGVHALQILLLASVPRSLVTFAIAESRAHRRIGVIVWLRGQNATLVLGLSFLLAPGWGVVGMAVAWLVAQLAGAGLALRVVWRRRLQHAGAAA